MGIYEHLCGPVHVQMCLCTHVVWRSGHSRGYHLQELHLLWGVFHWPGTHQLITCQAGEPQGPSCLYLPSAAITSTCCYSGILCDLGDSAGSKACKANTSPTDYFPQSTIDSNFFSSQYWELNLWLCACWATACPLNSISALYVSPEERFVSWLLR